MEEYIEKSGVQHLEIEEEFEKKLMRKEREGSLFLSAGPSGAGGYRYGGRYLAFL